MYLKSRNQFMSLSSLKDGCISLRFTGDFVSAVSLWHKRAVKISYKKCRFATFTRCLRTATALAHTLKLPFYYLSILSLVHVTLDTRPCDVTEPEWAWEQRLLRETIPAPELLATITNAFAVDTCNGCVLMGKTNSILSSKGC